jgi:chromosome partitioning protein
MAKKYTITLPKGGIGKSTIARNLGQAIDMQVAPARSGKKVLLIDLDPQANLTQSIGVRPGRLRNTVYTSLVKLAREFKSDVQSAILPVTDTIDLLPANVLLTRANDEFASAVKKESLLQRLLQSVEDEYSVMVADTQPNFGLLVNSALAWADEVIAPLQAETDAIESAALLLEHLKQLVELGLNDHLTISGLLFSQISYTKLHRDAMSFSYTTFGPYVQFFEQMIPRSIVYAEARSQCQTIFDHKPGSQYSQVFSDLAEALLSGERRTVIRDMDLKEGFLDDVMEQVEVLEEIRGGGAQVTEVAGIE